MPQENSFMRFHSGQYQFKVPFVIYANLESILEGLEEETNSDPLSSYMREINHHISSRFFTYTTFEYREVKDPLRLYRGKDYVKAFCATSRRKPRDFTICSPQS